MRKTLSFVVCVSLAFILGYSTLHPAYLMFADWLGPVMGYSLLTCLTVLYLLLGDPLRFLWLAIMWAVVSFLGGAIIRRRVGSVLTMLTVFLFFIPFLLLNAYSMVEPLSALMSEMGQDGIFSVLPPLPSGMTITQLIQAPILGQIFEMALDAVQAGDVGGPEQLVYRMVTPILVGVGEKVVIIVFAALVGVEVGSRLEPFLRPYSESLRRRLGGSLPVGGGGGQSGDGAFKTLFLLLILLTPTFIVHNVSYALDESYSENLMGYLDEDGGASLGSLFMSSEAGRAIDWDHPDAEGLLGALMLSQVGMKQVLPRLSGMEEMAENLGPLMALIPDTMMIVAYIDVPPEVAATRSAEVSRVFGRQFDTELEQLMAFEAPPLTGEDEAGSFDVSLVLYQTPLGLEEFAATYMDEFVAHGGLAEVLDEGLKNGRLLPGATPDSAEGSLMFAGFVNLELIGSVVDFEGVPSNYKDLVPVDLTAPLGVAGGMAFWGQGFVSEEGEHAIDLLSLLGFQGSASFSDDTDLSMVLLAAPGGTDVGGDEVPNVKLTTSLPVEDPRLETIYRILSQLGIMNLAGPGEHIDVSSFSLPVTGVSLPLMVSMTKEVSPRVSSPNGLVDVTVTVKNEDTVSMTDVYLVDPLSLQGYGSSSRISSGVTSEHWASIGPGDSRAVTYTLRLTSGGVYSLSPATVEYMHDGVSYDVSSNSLDVKVAQPNPVSLLIMALRTSGSSLTEILNLVTGGRGSMLLMVSTLLILGLLAFVEYRNFTKWMNPEQGTQ